MLAFSILATSYFTIWTLLQQEPPQNPSWIDCKGIVEGAPVDLLQGTPTHIQRWLHGKIIREEHHSGADIFTEVVEGGHSVSQEGGLGEVNKIRYIGIYQFLAVLL